jgi:hypothetical protein
VCRTKRATWTPPELNSRPAESKGGGASFNNKAGRQIGWWNRCNVRSNVIKSSDSSCETTPRGMTGAGSWGEVHVDAPLREPLANPVGPYGTSAALMGAANTVSIRIWRECRREGASYVTGGTAPEQSPSIAGGDCEVDPIYERTIPASDNNATQQTYFWAARSGGRTAATGSYTNSAFSALGKKDSAGVLFRACTGSNLCNDTAGYKGGISYPDACRNGGISTVKWSRDEVLAELEYLTTSDDVDLQARKFWRDRENTIKSWADGSRNSLPPISASARARFCRDFSEWLAVDWDVPGRKSSSTKLQLNFNAIPDRLYGVQVVITDPRENILAQSFQFLTGAATPSPPVPGGRCIPGTGDPRCPNPPSPTPSAPEPAPVQLAATFPKSAVAGAGSVVTADTRPTGADLPDNGSSSDDRARKQSIWLPRALSFSVFNPADDTGSDDAALSQYRTNHQNPKVNGGGDTFDLAGRGMARKPAPSRSSSGSVDDRVDSELGHAGASARYLSAFAPLLATGGLGLASRVSMATINPTRAVNDGWVNDGGLLKEDYDVRARGDEIRAATLIGEAKSYSYSNVNASSRYRWERLTMDTCDDGVSTRYPAISGVGCSPGHALRNGWKASDAYYVPARSSGDVALDALFMQDGQDKDPETDEYLPAEARIQLQGTDPNLHARVRRIEIWSQERFLRRSDDDQPNYVIADGRAPLAGGEARFCRAREKVFHPAWDEPQPNLVTSYNVRAYHRLWWTNPWHAGAPDIVNPRVHPSFYNDEYFGGLPGVSADVKFFLHNPTGRLWQVDGEGGHGNKPAPWKPNDYSVVYGRSWWDDTNAAPGPDGINDNVGRRDLYYEEAQPPIHHPAKWTHDGINPECMDHGGNSNAQDPEAVYGTSFPDGLRTGQYVVRYIVTPGPAFHWGIRARLKTNDTATPRVSYDLQNRQGFLQVFRSRTAG